MTRKSWVTKKSCVIQKKVDVIPQRIDASLGRLVVIPVMFFVWVGPHLGFHVLV